MSDVKIGWNQLNKPAPLGYRRFVNAYTVCIAPALVAGSAGWGFADKTMARIGIVVTFSIALVKGLGMVLGNGQIYSPSNQVIDSQSTKQ